MVLNSLGYIFDARRDSRGVLGLMENFKFQYRDNIQTVEILCVTDKFGTPLIPAVNDLSEGFIPLPKTLNSEGEGFEFDLDRFVKSNKPYFGKWGSFCYICMAKLKFDRNTGEYLADQSDITFYVPKNTSDKIPEIKDHKGNQMPAIVCQRINDKEGVNIFCVGNTVIEAFKKNFLKTFEFSDFESRFNYMKKRIQYKNTNQ